MESVPCKRSFDETVEIAHEYVSLQVVCFGAEDQAQVFKAQFKVGGALVESASIAKWEDEATLVLTLRKQDAPIYWDSVIVESQGMQVGLWNNMHKAFSDQLAEYEKRKMINNEF